MSPKKPMNSREIQNYITSLLAANNRLQQENEQLRTDTNSLKADSNSIKANQIIIDFIKMSRTELVNLPAAQKSIQIFKVLKALCRSQLED